MPWIYPPFGGVLLYLAYKIGGCAPLSWFSALAARLDLASNQPQGAFESLHAAENSSPFRRGGEGVAPELYAEIAEGRAAAYVETGNLKVAIEQQQRAVTLTPSVSARWARLADLLQRSGQTQAAAEAREKAQELSAPAPSGP
jgi:tetratricopeptide (TPR) repeat protein